MTGREKKGEGEGEQSREEGGKRGREKSTMKQRGQR